MDNLSKKKRSWNMSRIKGKNTKPELVVRSFLHRNGFRFRLHAQKLPGKPDIVFPKYRVALFVHGCFWHRHKGCKYSPVPKSRRKFWIKKLNDNIERFRENDRSLRRLGWKVVVIWECEIKDARKLLKLSDVLKRRIQI